MCARIAEYRQHVASWLDMFDDLHFEDLVFDDLRDEVIATAQGTST